MKHLVDQINRAFAPQPYPSLGKHQRMNRLRAQARDLADHLCENCDPGRELSLALTHLEQAMLWADAAITRETPSAAPPPPPAAAGEAAAE